MKTLTKKQKFWLFSALDVFFALIIPIILIVIKYDLFTNNPDRADISVSGWGIITILFLVFGLNKRVRAYVASSKNSQLKYFLFLNIGFLLVLYFPSY
jgi:hypothetical protein